MESGQISQRSLSAVSLGILAIQYSLESTRQDLHHALTVLQISDLRPKKGTFLSSESEQISKQILEFAVQLL